MEREIDGRPLDVDRNVVRMWYRTSLHNGSGSGALVAAFELSSEDKNANQPYLSVFEKSNTTLDQAKIFTGKNLALSLSVSEVRELINPNYPDYRLNICWYRKTVTIGDQIIPDERPGAAGHCGIIGLLRPPNLSRTLWKWFRVRLADIAFSNNPITVL